MAEARQHRERVVRPLAAASGRACARPGCPAPARATLSLVYDDRVLVLEGLHDESSPATYDLCGTHADRTGPPYGWELRDGRRPADLDPDRPRDLGGPDTVAVLAQALNRGRDDAAPTRGPVAQPPAATERSPRIAAATAPVPHRAGPVDAPVVTADVPRPRPVLAARPASEPDRPSTADPAGAADGAIDDAAEELAALAAVLAEIADDDPPRDTDTYLRQIEAIADAVPDVARSDHAASPPTSAGPAGQHRAAGEGARAQAW
ncbi:MAG: DUF3499 family protein [Actinobacteria bacterium]|nr:DUF3499 family protein [Actinomycetota bacterium]